MTANELPTPKKVKIIKGNFKPSEIWDSKGAGHAAHDALDDWKLRILIAYPADTQRWKTTSIQRQDVESTLFQLCVPTEYYKDTFSLDETHPVSILRKSISGRHQAVRVADGPMTAQCRFT